MTALDLPTAAEVGTALARLENWRVLHVQQACYPYKPVPASALLAIGFRETGLKNICGGADLVNGEWVESNSDRGWLQVSDKFASAWLKTVPGCANGEWSPAVPAVSALTPLHVPRFSDALAYTVDQLHTSMRFAAANGVAEKDLLQFAIAAHNAGDEGALAGYRKGDVDLFTAHGNYSEYCLAIMPLIHTWIAEHIHWVYHPETGQPIEALPVDTFTPIPPPRLLIIPIAGKTWKAGIVRRVISGGAIGLNPKNRELARRRLCGAALEGVRRRLETTYTEGALRWDGIRFHRNPWANPKESPHYADCSAFATWCAWIATRDWKLGDFVNGAGWLAGYTGTMFSRCQAVSLNELLHGDFIGYGGSPSIPFHVAVYVGDGHVVSHGQNGDPRIYNLNLGNVMPIVRAIRPIR